MTASGHRRSSVVNAPDPLPSSDGRPIVFLGGSIDMGTAPDWQAAIIAALGSLPAVILNPRRSDWNPSIRTEADDPQFRAQVEWEMAALDAADVIVLHLASGFRSPITLLELGLHAQSGRIVLFCEEGYWRKGNVDLVAERYGIARADTFDELAYLVARRVEEIASTGGEVAEESPT